MFSNHFSFFLSPLFFHCCLGQDDFTLTFNRPSDPPSETVFEFHCSENARWNRLEDGKVNQYLVNATYLNLKKPDQVLRTGYINTELISL